jgi:hypothetical protein
MILHLGYIYISLKCDGTKFAMIFFLTNMRDTKSNSSFSRKLTMVAVMNYDEGKGIARIRG